MRHPLIRSIDKSSHKNNEYNCPNWDKCSWLSSREYFKDLISHLAPLLNICNNSKVLDVGCARGFFLKNLVNNFSFGTRPIGIDIVDHLWGKKTNIEFINSDFSTFLSMYEGEFDFIFIKQVLHLIPYKKRQALWGELKKKLATNGNIVIMQMSKDFKIPCFPLMKEQLKKSVNSHQEIYLEMNKQFTILSEKKYAFHVSISRDEYINLLKDRYLSSLFYFSEEHIRLGSLWVEENYPLQISFEDRLDISIIGK